MKLNVNSIIIELVKGDVTSLNVDAIVNAANSELQLGLGVAGAVRKNGGPTIQDECNEIISQKGRISVGNAVITKGGNLKAKYVIHAVGPYGDDQNRKNLLKNAIKNSLTICANHKLTSIGIPAISTGIYGYPIQEASEVILSTCKEFAKEDSSINHIKICLFDLDYFEIFKETMAKFI